MRIIRYSIHGFKPQYQSHHLKEVHFHLHNFSVEGCPEHLKPFVLQDHKKKHAFLMYIERRNSGPVVIAQEMNGIIPY